MKDPVKIKIAKGLLVFKIGLILVLSILASILFFTSEPQGLWGVVKQAILDRTGHTIYDDPSIVLAGFLPSILISFATTIGVLYFLVKKKQAGFYILIGLECFYSFNSNGIIPFFSLAILLLVFSQKDYFPVKKKMKKTQPTMDK